MRVRKSDFVALAMLAGGLGAAQGAQAREPYPGNSVILFVASWCGPCHGELARLGAINAAASPRRVMVVPVDNGPDADRMMRRVPRHMIWQPAPWVAARMRHDFFSDQVVLPLSVMTDGAGRVCAHAVAGLTAGAIRRMQARCG